MSQIQSSPPFEGCEKKLVIYLKRNGKKIEKSSFRDLSRDEWSLILKECKCSILNVISNKECDSYLLSESSLFVFENKLMIKTCGTTTLLYGIPLMISRGKELGLEIVGLEYSRSELMYPTLQLEIHQNFDHEIFYLTKLFGTKNHQTLTLGNERNKWYVFDYQKQESKKVEVKTCKAEIVLEMAMFDLDPAKMKVFFKDYLDKMNIRKKENHKAFVREESGIASLLPKNAMIDDYLFTPCGYSLNGLLDDKYWSIHVTPEDNGSYVSFETNSSDSLRSYKELIGRVLVCFGPSKFTVTMTFKNCDDYLKKNKELSLYGLFMDYSCNKRDVRELNDGFILCCNFDHHPMISNKFDVSMTDMGYNSVGNSSVSSMDSVVSITLDDTSGSSSLLSPSCNSANFGYGDVVDLDEMKEEEIKPNRNGKEMNPLVRLDPQLLFKI